MIVTQTRTGFQCEGDFEKLPKEGDRLYFLQIGNKENRLFKIGTTNNIYARMGQHLRYYKENIKILWFSPIYSKYTTLRLEDRYKVKFQDLCYDYIPNDRFIIPEEVTEITIKVKKEYKIAI